MRIALVALFVASSGASALGAWGCTSQDAARPTPPAPAALADGGGAVPPSTPSPPVDDAGASEDAGPCALVEGGTLHAKFDFAATAPGDGGKGQILSVSVCDTVVWTNDDTTVHGVVSTGDAGFSFSTGTVLGTAAGVPLRPIQFPIAGTFTYECVIHGAMMIGEITVK